MYCLNASTCTHHIVASAGNLIFHNLQQFSLFFLPQDLNYRLSHVYSSFLSGEESQIATPTTKPRVSKSPFAQSSGPMVAKAWGLQPLRRILHLPTSLKQVSLHILHIQCDCTTEAELIPSGRDGALCFQWMMSGWSGGGNLPLVALRSGQRSDSADSQPRLKGFPSLNKVELLLKPSNVSATGKGRGIGRTTSMAFMC